MQRRSPETYADYFAALLRQDYTFAGHCKTAFTGQCDSCKKGVRVDERSEIAACVDGIPQNHLGERTDVIDCCPKAEGMLMVIRAMSPDIVAVDEIGGKKDIEAIESVIHCGCIVIGTVHGADVKERIGNRNWVRC